MSTISYRPGKGRRLRLMKRHWQLYVLILPAVIAILIFHYWPIYGLQIAFKNYRPSKGIWGSDWVGIKWFLKFFSYANFWKIIGNTISISLLSLAMFPCAVILALMINEVYSKKFKRYVQMVTYAPHFVSTVIVCSMVIMFTQYNNGVINNIRSLLGAERVDIITVPKYFPWVYVVSGLWQNIGWDAIIYIAALAGVSDEMIEAARIDGANRFQVLWHISIPTILPTIITMLILNTGKVLSVGFEKIFLLQNSLNLDASRVISTYVYEIGIEGGQFSYSAAIGFFNCFVNCVIILTVNKLSKKLTDIGLF